MIEDHRTSSTSDDVAPVESKIIDLRDVHMLDVPERCRESLQRIQGWMVLRVAEEIIA